MVNESKSGDTKKPPYTSPLAKANAMDHDDDEANSNKLRAKYTNIKNEINYDTSSLSSTYKTSTLEKKSLSQISGMNKEDDKGAPWTTITPNNEAYVDWANPNDNSSKTDSHGSSAVELVVAVKSAIQQRQDILEEWKKKAEDSIADLHKLKKSKESLESSIVQKDTLITKLTKDLSDIQNQYNSMNDDTNSLKKNYESVKLDKEKLNSLYHCALQELSEARRKLTTSEEQRDKLERRFRIQEEENEHWFKKGEQIEAELATSKAVISSLKSEIVDLEEKLAVLQAQLTSKSTAEKNDTEAIENLKTKLTQSLEELKKEIEKNRNSSSEMAKMQQVIDKLESDRNDVKRVIHDVEEQRNTLQTKNNKLQEEISQLKQKNESVLTSCSNLENMVANLERKINEYESENAKLKKQLTEQKTENDLLQEELEKAEMKLKTSENQLNNISTELEKQISLFNEATSNINLLQNEKISISKQLKSLEDMDKKRLNELNRLLSDNKALKILVDNIRNDLSSKNEQLKRAQNEAKSYNQQLKCVESDLNEERSKHNEELFALQEKAKASNDYWKNYVEKEIAQIKQTYMEKLHRHCEEYSSMIAQSNSRDISFTSEQQPGQELVDEIGHLKKQLGDSIKKLEDAILQAESSRKQILEKTAKEQQQLLEKLNPSTKLNSGHIAEIESRIQSMISHFIEGNNAFHLLESENKSLKEKLEKYKKKYEENKTIDIATKELLAERDQLRIELGHSKNLTSLAEEAGDRLKQDLADSKRKLDERAESIEFLKSEQITLKKNLGKKDAQINLLNQSIENLKNKISEYERDSSDVKILLSNIEHDKLIHEKDILIMKNEMEELKSTLDRTRSSKKEVSLLNEKLNKELFDLRGDIKTKTNEINSYNETVQKLQNQLHISQQEITQLKNKLKEVPQVAIQDNKNFKELMDKFVDSNKKISKLQQQIVQLNNDSKEKENMHLNRLKSIENEIKLKITEINHLNEIIQSEDLKNKKLQQCLDSTDKIFTECIRIFDEYGEVTAQLLKIPYECISEPLCVNHNECEDQCYYEEKIELINLYDQKMGQVKNALSSLIEKEHELSQRLTEQEEQHKLDSVNAEKKINSQKNQLENLQKIINSKQEEFDKIHQQLIDIQLLQSSHSDDLSKSISEHLERQRYAMTVTEENRNSIRNELVNLNKRMHNLVNEKRELELKVQELESVSSMYQIKMVSLEGEIENLNLKLKESSVRDIEQNDLISKITSNNRDLNDQILKYKFELQKLQNQLNEKVNTAKSSEEEINKEECTNKHCCLKNKCMHLHSSLADLELQKNLLQERLESSQKSEHIARLNMVSMEDKIKTLNSRLDAVQLEKASLEGWVQHLQKMLQSDKSIYNNMSPSSTQENPSHANEILQYKGKLKQLEIDNSHLRKKLDQLNQQISSCPSPTSSTDQHKIIAERDEYEKKFFQAKKSLDEKEVEIANLKSEVNAIKQRYLKSSDLQRSNIDEAITTGSDISLDKRVTACVVTYSHKSDSRNSSFSRDSQKKYQSQQKQYQSQQAYQQNQHSNDFKCEDCDHKYDQDSSAADHISQKMMPVSSSSIAMASTEMQKYMTKENQSVDISKEKQVKKKFSRRKKTIL